MKLYNTNAIKDVNGKDEKKKKFLVGDFAIDLQEKWRKISSKKGSCVERQMV